MRRVLRHPGVSLIVSISKKEKRNGRSGCGGISLILTVSRDLASITLRHQKTVCWSDVLEQKPDFAQVDVSLTRFLLSASCSKRATYRRLTIVVLDLVDRTVLINALHRENMSRAFMNPLPITVYRYAVCYQIRSKRSAVFDKGILVKRHHRQGNAECFSRSSECRHLTGKRGEAMTWISQTTSCACSNLRNMCNVH